MEQAELVVRGALHRIHHRSPLLAITILTLLGLATVGCSGGTDRSLPTTSAAAAVPTTVPAASGPVTTAPATTAPATTGPATTAPAGLPGADIVGDAFYAPPEPLPAGAPGALVRARPMSAPSGAQAWQIMYLSRSATGQAIAVTGAIYAPTTASATTPRNILAWAHGTTGLGDQCTPSKAAAAGKGSELLLAQAALAKGLAFVYTDYEGLGTPGVHTYVVGRSEGRTVLDSVRAAQRFPGIGTSADSKAVVWGHSQGGGAALWAAELQPTYAPEVAVAGVIAGAPAAELRTLGERLRTSPFFGYQLMTVAGFAAAYPQLDLGEILTPEGEAVVKAAGSQCSAETLAAVRGQDPSRYFLAGALSAPDWVAAIDDNSPGTNSTPVPIFIYQGDQDEQIPVDTSATVTAKYCALGVTVARKVYPGANHTSVIPLALIEISSTIDARLAGQPAPSTC